MGRLSSVPSVTFDELSFAYAVGGQAAEGAIPQSGVGGMGVNLDMRDGDIKRFELTDIPINRAAIAIRDQFPKGKMMPIMLRIMAMNEMLRLPEAQPYIRPDPDNPVECEMNEALLRVAAEMPLNGKLSFNKSVFFKRVAKRFAEAVE